MNTLYESMTRMLLPEHGPRDGLIVRIWRHEPDPAKTNNADLWEFQKTFRESKDAKAIADSILLMDRVNAVEVVDMTGQGWVAYKDWP